MDNNNIFHQNYEEDFLYLFRFSAGIPDYPWRLIFNTHIGQQKSLTSFTASFDGKTYTNCNVLTGTVDTILVQFKNHRLPPGMLHYRLLRRISNDLFDDGEQKKVLPQPLTIELWDGPTDAEQPVTTIILEQMLRGDSAYEGYKKHHPESELTESEYCDAPIAAADAVNGAAEKATKAAERANTAATKADVSAEAADRAATGAVEAAETAESAAESAREAADAVVWLRARPVLLEIEKNAEGHKTIRVTVHGLEPGIPLSEYEVRLFREGVFRRVKGTDGFGPWRAVPPSRGWVHPQHRSIWDIASGYEKMNPGARYILSRFTLTSPENGGLIPTGYSDTPVTWQDLFDGCFKVTRDDRENVIRVTFGTTRKTVFDTGNVPIVVSFPIRNRVALALYHNGKRVSNMATVSLSFTVTSEGWKGANTVYRGYVNRI